MLKRRGIAQPVEQRSPKPHAEGSIPSAPAKIVNSKKARKHEKTRECVFFCFLFLRENVVFTIAYTAEQLT